MMSGPAAPPDVGEFGLTTQFRPHLVDRFGRGGHEIDTLATTLVTSLVTTPTGTTLGLGVPDLLHLEQAPVAPAQVVLTELQRGSPPCPFEFTTIRLLQDRTVLALAHQALTRRGKGSGDHGSHLGRPALWSVSPDCL